MSAIHHSQRWMSVSLAVTGGVLLAVTVGCPQPETRQGPDDRETTTSADEVPEEDLPRARDDVPTGSTAGAASPDVRRSPLPRRPSPEAVCGHAVAFAGWKPSADGSRDILLLCDPGDNAIAKVGHAWESNPREAPLHYGERRPTVVLLPSGVFTVTGAIVITPVDTLPRPRFEMTSASGMPDLAQDFNPRWPGLCGPTAAADILYAMHATSPMVLEGFAVGPGRDGDAAVERLVVGGDSRITAASLAGRMGIGQDGDGATNIGMSEGCRSWLDEHDRGGWLVELRWLDDEVFGQDEQREFIALLAAALDAGGGAILCLWPGSEFADEAIRDVAQATGTADEAAASTAPSSVESAAKPPGAFPGNARGSPASRPEPTALPEALFPALPPPPAENRPVLPGVREAEKDSALVRAEARKKREAAEARLAQGDLATALALAIQGVELVSSASRHDAACRNELDRLVALCKTLDSRLPRRPAAEEDKPTVFE